MAGSTIAPGHKNTVIFLHHRPCGVSGTRGIDYGLNSNRGYANNKPIGEAECAVRAE